MTIRSENVPQYIGRTLFDDGGNPVGVIGALFLDDVTGQPAWLTVNTGDAGSAESLVPVAGAGATDAGLAVPVSTETIRNAPRVDLEQGPLSSAEEADLYRYYGIQYTDPSSDPVIGTAPDLTDPSQSNIGRTDLIQHDADFDDSDATGMSAGPATEPTTEPSTEPATEPATEPTTGAGTGAEAAAPGTRTRLRRWTAPKQP